MKGSIKCTHCGTWNEKKESTEFACTECGSMIKNQLKERQSKQIQFDKDQLDKWMFTIKESDNGFIKASKKIGNVIYMIFMAIVAFIAWVVAVLPG